MGVAHGGPTQGGAAQGKQSQGGHAQLDVDLAFGAAATGGSQPAGAVLAVLDLPGLDRELPTVAVAPGASGEPVDVERWRAGLADLRAFDARVDELGAGGRLVLRLRG